MTRKPVYHKESKEYRIVSRPNGLWVAQRRLTEHGTPEQDNWQDQQKPTTYDNAMAKMYQLLPTRG